MNMKRRRIGKPDNLSITLMTRPLSDANSDDFRTGWVHCR